MYQRLLDTLRGRGEGDSIHSASAIAVEYQSTLAFILLAFLAARMVNLYFGAAAALAVFLAMRNRVLTFDVFTENDDRIQTLMYYLILTLAACLALTGWLA